MKIGQLTIRFDGSFEGSDNHAQKWPFTPKNGRSQFFQGQYTAVQGT